VNAASDRLAVESNMQAHLAKQLHRKQPTFRHPTPAGDDRDAVRREAVSDQVTAKAGDWIGTSFRRRMR
jgi:hypothetical protein